jgi:hypothetical protein
MVEARLSTVDYMADTKFKLCIAGSFKNSSSIRERQLESLYDNLRLNLGNQGCPIPLNCGPGGLPQLHEFGKRQCKRSKRLWPPFKFANLNHSLMIQEF